MRVDEGGDLSAALLAETAGVTVMADASGAAYVRTGAARIRVLVGPEGGWTEDEVRLAREAGAIIARFGEHVMRVETAAPVAAAVVLAAESRGS